MCMTCGCMMVDKKMSPDAITLDDLLRIADSHGLEPEEVVYNMQISMDAFFMIVRERKEKHEELMKNEEKNRLDRLKKKTTTNLQNSQK